MLLFYFQGYFPKYFNMNVLFAGRPRKISKLNGSLKSVDSGKLIE